MNNLTDDYWTNIKNTGEALTKAARQGDLAQELYAIGWYLKLIAGMLNELNDLTVRNQDWLKHISK